ncbi:MAG: C40 family peptidase [Bacteroidota bacterium]
MRQILTFSIIIVLFYGGRSFFFSGEQKTEKAVKTAEKKPKVDPLTEILKTAHDLVGSPYRGGGRTPEGFDCSGFVGYVFASQNIQLPRSSKAMAKAGKEVGPGEWEAGDLLFFQGSNQSDPSIGHVGILYEKKGDQIYMVHASNRGVVIDDISRMRYYRDRYLMARRVID